MDIPAVGNVIPITNITGSYTVPFCNMPDRVAAFYMIYEFSFSFRLPEFLLRRTQLLVAYLTFGGIGFYNLPSEKSCSAGTCSPQTGLNDTNAVGYNFGAGVRHRLYYGKLTELFAEWRRACEAREFRHLRGHERRCGSGRSSAEDQRTEERRDRGHHPGPRGKIS